MVYSVWVNGSWGKMGAGCKGKKKKGKTDTDKVKTKAGYFLEFSDFLFQCSNIITRSSVVY